MANKVNAQKEFTIHFEHASYFRMYPSNGAWGGITPHGDFALEFFVERNKPPSKVVHSVEGIQVGAELRREPQQHIVREFQAGIVMSQDEAVSMAKFILQKVEEYASQIISAKSEKADSE